MDRRPEPVPRRTARILRIAIALLLLGAVPAAAQSSFARGTALNWPAVLSGAFLGFLLLPIAYNSAFLVILLERFLLWDSARILALVALTLCLSSLPLGPVLGAESLARQVAINVLFDGVIALMGPFLGTLPAGFRKALVRLPPRSRSRPRRRCSIPARAAQIPAVTGPVTASAGVAHLDDTMSYGEALKAADLELYAAKAAGRNCCVADRTVDRARAAA